MSADGQPYVPMTRGPRAEWRPVRFAADERPRLIVVIDTEEEGGWGGSYSRDRTEVKAMRESVLAQRIFNEFGVKPHWVIDYPVASQPEGYEPLRQFLAEGTCEVGAHIHPWVNPPYDEQVSKYTSFAGNLAYRLERAKIAELARVIEQNLGVRPRVFKAGRYGAGPNTPEILRELGFEVDLSGDPGFNYAHEGGPDYRFMTADTYWIGADRQLLGIPCTGGYLGRFHKLVSLYDFARKPLMQKLKLQAIMTRLGIIDRQRLSPETYTSAEHRQLTKCLWERGVRVFCLSFHSPTLMVGGSPYVRSEADLKAFLGSIRRYLEFFLGEFGGVATTAVEIREHLLRTPSQP